MKSAKSLLENNSYKHEMLVSLNIDKEDLIKLGLDENLESSSILINNYINKETNEFYQEGTFLNGKINLESSRYYSDNQSLIKEPTYHKYIRFKKYKELGLVNSASIKEDAILNYLTKTKLKGLKHQTIYDMEAGKDMKKLTYVVKEDNFKEFADIIKSSILNNVQYENLVKEYLLIKNKLTKTAKSDNEVMLETGLIIDNLNSTLDKLTEQLSIKDMKMDLIIDDETLKELDITANVKLNNDLNVEFNMNLGFKELSNEKMLGRSLRIDDFSIMNYENMNDSVDYFENENLKIENVITPIKETKDGSEGQEGIQQ